eukprot:CAMPEP_0198341858 /NCGR_PEP_ID=MMETSP1450-20131203/49949_1 /TAXON_ID=753684 ORGANISM="Madagascaria erythrocladiodes, Strain CCMP3234" /NCGR_SAMPLE_ID=MMETSP1450 /ASSEMBLY_ACC=CAM_ASM_001115 /LENGTH=69 /DNA_ID=CAMNT_0044046919 /DNA_START=221 /DNA_END=430 /DNA_ORIENTATION=+
MGDASQYQSWVGKFLKKDADAGADDVKESQLPNNHRVLKPDSMTTMDHQPTRLNVHVDNDGKITDVKFG